MRSTILTTNVAYGDFKIIRRLLGLQGWVTKHCCFLCLWDSRTTTQHYKTKEWPTRNSYVHGIKGIQHILLVNPDKILMLPLQIKLGLTNKFVKDKYPSNGFEFFKKISQTNPSQFKRRNHCWSTNLGRFRRVRV